MATTLGAVAFVVLILFAIGFHEFGHFITARWAKIKVSRFFVGFGPTLWSVRRGRPETILTEDGTTVSRPETEYGIKALPLGGFVKVVGMSPFEEIDPADEARSFQSAPVWKRAIVLSAGSVTHFVTAFFVLFLVFAAVGLPGAPSLTVSEVIERIDGEPAPAAVAGLEAGDQIVAVDGRGVQEWPELQQAIQASPGRSLALTVLRDGRETTLAVTPRADTVAGEEVGVIGVFPGTETVRYGPIESISRSAGGIGMLLTGLVDAAPRAFTPENLGIRGEPSPENRPFSILGAGRIAADFATEGQLAMFLLLFVNINVFIAIFNMLPLPPLDGGHLLVLGIEKIRGKPVDQRVLLPVMAVVFSLLIMLGVLLLYNDIVSPPQIPGQ